MNLQQFFSIMWARKWLICAILTTTLLATGIITFITPKQYVATTSLYLEQRLIDPVTGGMLPAQLMSGFVTTQSEIIKSHAVASLVVDFLDLTQNKKYQADFIKSKGKGELNDWIADALLKNLSVIPAHDSNIIQVGYKSPDPNFSVEVANTFAKAYIQTNVDLRLQPAQQQADWYESQMDSLKQKMEASREQLSSYQQSSGIVTAKDRLDIEDARLNDINQQLVANQGHTYELIAVKKQLGKALQESSSFESLQEVLNNNFVQSLKTDLSKAEANLAETAVKVDQNHPQYKQAQAEVNNLKKKINEEIATVLNGINSKVAASKQRDEILTNELEKQKAKVLALKKQHNEIDVLSEEVQNTQKTYDTAMQRSIQTRMESEASLSNISILNRAILPQSHDSPKLSLNLFLGMFLGTLLGIGAAFLTELFDRRVRSPLDITNQLDVPVFGVMTKTTPTKNQG